MITEENLCSTLKRLNVGCGREKIEGYVGLDYTDYGQKYVRDIRDGIPGLWDEIRASHFLEHLDQVDALCFLDDCWNKCKELHIIVPHKDKDSAWDLTHKTFYTEATFRALEVWEFPWTITKMVTNKRKDIHVWMKPML